MSIAGGFDRAVERALSVGGTALQIFSKSASQWRARPIARDEAARFREACAAAGFGAAVMAHASYLINLASPDPALWERSKEAFREELERCDVLGVPYLVLHPGSHVGSGVDAGIERVAVALREVLASPGEAAVLLEVTAGQGTNLGSRFEEIGAMLDRVERPDRTGVCFDTCHALAAGYELRDAAGYRATWDAFERHVGLARLRAFHLNDSKFDLGSRRDRHEHIGEGRVGDDGFRLLMRDPRFVELPMVLETPKGPDLAEDRRNLDRLCELARP